MRYGKRITIALGVLATAFVGVRIAQAQSTAVAQQLVAQVRSGALPQTGMGLFEASSSTRGLHVRVSRVGAFGNALFVLVESDPTATSFVPPSAQTSGLRLNGYSVGFTAASNNRLVAFVPAGVTHWPFYVGGGDDLQGVVKDASGNVLFEVAARGVVTQ